MLLQKKGNGLSTIIRLQSKIHRLIQPIFHETTTRKSGKDVVKRQDIAFVLCHESEDALAWVNRCSAVGISNGNHHADSDIVYVNRYDWSHYHGKSSDIKSEFEKLANQKPQKETDDGHLWDELTGGRFCMVDCADYDSFFKALVASENSDGVFTTSTGTHITFRMTEYELGWMCYSGKKDSTFPDCDELVAFIYDHTYFALDSSEGKLVLDLGG